MAAGRRAARCSALLSLPYLPLGQGDSGAERHVSGTGRDARGGDRLRRGYPRALATQRRIMGAGHIDADVVVVGGGPAGAATAIACATRRKRVVLIERDLFARERPGETLHPGVEPLLTQLGIAERLPGVVGARHDGIWIEWGGPPRFAPFGSDACGPWRGFQVWRAHFDALLLT